jgi:hypothetical protein
MCINFYRLSKIFTKIKETLIHGFWIRFILESYLEYSICLFVNLTQVIRFLTLTSLVEFNK